MVLLRFIYLTLPNCAGKLLKALSKEEKQEKNTKRQKDEQKGTFTRLQFASRSQWRVASASKSRKAHLLASNSPPTRNDELSKRQHRQKHSFTRHGE